MLVHLLASQWEYAGDNFGLCSVGSCALLQARKVKNEKLKVKNQMASAAVQGKALCPIAVKLLIRSRNKLV